VTKPLTIGAAARHDAVAELFEALDALMIDYRWSPEAERVQRWSADAERITGEVARHLCAARTRIAQRPQAPQRETTSET
jgi:hypothetical protein